VRGINLHSFILLNTVKLFSHYQILVNLKSYGIVHDVYVKNIFVCCTVFADALF
jgi:hypothetical protein